jgi:hypothetical protein
MDGDLGGMNMQRMIVLFFLITIFFVNGVEAKSLKKGEVYSLLNGRETMEVISSSELEITERGTTFVAEYEFKGDKLRVVANVMGTKQVQYYLLTNEGLKDEKTGEVYYSKAGLVKAKEKLKEEEKGEELKKTTYTDNGNGTVTQGTGLMWQKEDDNTKRKWKDAIKYCKGLSLGGYTDWRLPYIGEFISIGYGGYGILKDNKRITPKINTTYFPNTKSSSYWSSAIMNGSSYAWQVYLGDGGGISESDESSYYYVRCVRGGQ